MPRTLRIAAALAVAVCCTATVARAFTPKDSGHCLIWVPLEKASEVQTQDLRLAAVETTQAQDAHASNVVVADAPRVCRYAHTSPSQTCAADEDDHAKIGSASSHLHVGVLDANNNCVPVSYAMDTQVRAGSTAGTEASSSSFSAPETAAVEVAHMDDSCKVWWREVSADVIPPIPELLLPLGATPEGAKLGICRTFGDGGEGDYGDDGVPRVGTIVLEGADYGRCFFTRADGGRGMRDGGQFHVLQARPSAPDCRNDEKQRAALRMALQARMDRFLSDEDRGLIARVTGHAFSELQSELLEEQGSCELAMVLSPARFIPSELNILGLHLMRCVLAERMYEARAESLGYDQHPDYATWRSQGIIFKDLDEIGDDGLVRLLQMVSGESGEDKPDYLPRPPFEWVGRNVTVSEPRDLQTFMHVDTFAAAIKIWVFANPPGVTTEQGPLNYVPGSQRNTEGKLRWMYAYSLPPAAEALLEPSFRLLGCPTATEAASDFVRWAQEQRIEAIPLRNSSRTVVIADTSGLHHRGVGVVGNMRVSWRLRGDTDGGLKRLNPFRWPLDGTADPGSDAAVAAST